MSAREGCNEFSADAADNNDGIKRLKAEGDRHISNSARKMQREMHSTGFTTEG
jgi:hypothetical protein